MNDNDGLSAAAGALPPQIDIATIKHMPIGDIMKMKPAILLTLVRQAEDDLRRATMVKDWLHGILVEKYKDQAHNVRQQLGKDTGTIRIEEDGVMVVANLPKKVEWDQKKLAEIIEKLTAEGWNIQQLATQTFKVSERQFNELPSGVRAMFEEARTIKVGKQTFKLEEPKEGEQ
jgi:hypothetical protein